MQANHSSGDILADKRFTYAQALADEGDLAGAADLFEQAVSRAPAWAPGYLGWGLALEKLGDVAHAEQTLAQAERLDREGVLGAGLHRARLAGQSVAALPAAYVATLFDQYAPHFDAHLTRELAYRGPEAMLDVLGRLGISGHKGAALDLGCGTGLMARGLGAREAPIDGIDLSPAMVDRAKATGLYRTLAVGDCAAVVGRLAARSYRLVVAADVLVYLGDLRPLFTAVAHVLAPGGVFVATVEAGAATGYALGDTLRFRHSAAYLRTIASGAALDVLALDPCVTRREAGRDVPGLVVAARAPQLPDGVPA